jgi:hypothetical protein
MKAMAAYSGVDCSIVSRAVKNSERQRLDALTSQPYWRILADVRARVMCAYTTCPYCLAPSDRIPLS